MGCWRRYLSWRQRNVTSVALTTDGFEWQSGQQTAKICWRDVARIVAFKRDLMTVDLLCLHFETMLETVEINEEMPGYAAVESEMESRFAFADDWKLRVLFPAFETNEEAIYDRASAVAPK